MSLMRSAACAVTVTAMAALAAAATARADSLEELARKAASAGPILWYESSPTEEMKPLIQKFQARFPGLELQHVRDTGGNAMAARIIQETQGGGRTADVASNGPPILMQLAKRDMLVDVDWAALGVAKEMAPAPYAVSIAASAYVLIYNNKAVPEAEAPKSFEALLEPRWKGRIGLWNRSESETSLAAVWGEEKTTDYIGKLKQQDPMLFPSSFPMVQSMASGELDVGWGAAHATLPTVRKGGPISLVFPDPLPVTTIYTFIPKGGRNPDGGKLFAAWLTTTEGALAYEAATGRGNLRVPETNYGKLAAGKTIAEIPLSRYDDYARIYEAYNALLAK